MARYNKLIVLLVCFSISTLVLMSRWLPLRITSVNHDYSIPSSGDNNAHDNMIDIISVAKTPTTNAHDGNEFIDMYKNLNDNVNINGTILTLGDKQTPTGALCKLCRKTKPVFIKENKPFVALASYPGSGNSWTRELLEYITGVYTGSVYIDSAGKFSGSQRCPLRGGVYIVKTHQPDNTTKHRDCDKIHGGETVDYQKAMFILRNPYDALLSFFNLRGGKVGFASRQVFQTEWRTFVRTKAREWKRMTLYWMTTFERPLHVIVYETLKKDIPNELFKVGTFLNFSSTYLDLYCAKSCLKPKYHRANKPEWMNITTLYHDESKIAVNTAIKDVIFAMNGMDDLVNALKGYLMGPES